MDKTQNRILQQELRYYSRLLEEYAKKKNILKASENERKISCLKGKRNQMQESILQHQPVALNAKSKYIFNKKNKNTTVYTVENKLKKLCNKKETIHIKKVSSPKLSFDQTKINNRSDFGTKLNSNISNTKYLLSCNKQFCNTSSMVKNSKYARVFAAKEINNPDNASRRKVFLKEESYCSVPTSRKLNSPKGLKNISVAKMFKTDSDSPTTILDKKSSFHPEMKNKNVCITKQQTLKDLSTTYLNKREGTLHLKRDGINKITNVAQNDKNTVQKFQVSKNGKHLVSSNLYNSNLMSRNKLNETKPLKNQSEFTKSSQKNIFSNLSDKQNTKVSFLNFKSAASYSNADINIRKPKSTPNKKIIASKYKVINKNVFNTDNRKMLLNSKSNNFKIVNHKSTNLQNLSKKNQLLSKSPAVISSKYKIVNKALKNPITSKRVSLPQLDEIKKSRKIHKVYKLVNNSIKVQGNTIPSKLETGSCKKVKSTTKIKSAHKIINVKPISKGCDASKSSKLYLNNKSPAISYVLKSKYKVVNKSSLTVQNSFERKKKYYIPARSSVVNVSQVHQLSPLFRSVLLRRLYKSKNVIINKNSSPINQTAKMIKTKYFALNKQRPLTYHKQLMTSTPKYKKSCQSRKLLYTKPKNFQLRFHNTHPSSRKYSKFCLVSSINVRKYSKVNLIQKRNTLSRRRSFPGKRSGTVWKRTFLKSPKVSSPIVRTLASRVLHRSINKAVTTCAKKKMKKVNAYCMFYNRFGRCNKGVKCTFIHDPSKIAVCTRFLRGTCKKEGCPFSHEVCPGKMALCSYFLLGSCKNDNCSYRHEKLPSNSELCKEFVQGYCSEGKKCKKAHILICPHFVKGICEKGEKCIFPHPPQRVKKIAIQQLEEQENEEELLEKMSRYFQNFTEEFTPNSSSKISDNCQIEVVIPPRIHNLPEQPSFIPLSGECNFHQQSSGSDEKV